MTAAARPRAQTVALLRDVGIIPVIRADSGEVAMRVVDALVEAELPVAEITTTVPDAMSVIARVAKRFGDDILVGAGTITSAAMAERAVQAGAKFIVSPGLVPEVIAAANDADVAVLPGALTPTEVMHAMRAGADMVKIFPAQSVGGASYIRALRGPFPTALLVPTGGVNLQTVGDFIRAGAAAVGVGSELVSREALEREDYFAIGSLAREFLVAIAFARGD